MTRSSSSLLQEMLLVLHYSLNSKNLQVEYVIGHQQLLEALSWQGGGGHRHALLPWKAKKTVDPEMDGELEVEVVVKLLKSLERLCPPKVSDSANNLI